MKYNGKPFYRCSPSWTLSHHLCPLTFHEGICIFAKIYSMKYGMPNQIGGLVCYYLWCKIHKKIYALCIIDSMLPMCHGIATLLQWRQQSSLIKQQLADCSGSLFHTGIILHQQLELEMWWYCTQLSIPNALTMTTQWFIKWVEWLIYLILVTLDKGV